MANLESLENDLGVEYISCQIHWIKTLIKGNFQCEAQILQGKSVLQIWDELLNFWKKIAAFEQYQTQFYSGANENQFLIEYLSRPET